jgi:hypothetical protein
MAIKQLDWVGIRSLGKQDKAGRWYPDESIANYFSTIRSPSRSWPNSYAKAAQTIKFAKWLVLNQPEQAARLGLV